MIVGAGNAGVPCPRPKLITKIKIIHMCFEKIKKEGGISKIPIS